VLVPFLPGILLFQWAHFFSHLLDLHIDICTSWYVKYVNFIHFANFTFSSFKSWEYWWCKIKYFQNLPFQETTSEQSNWIQLNMAFMNVTDQIWCRYLIGDIDCCLHIWSMSGLPADCCSAKVIIMPKICISFQNPPLTTNFVEIWQWQKFNSLPMWHVNFSKCVFAIKFVKLWSWITSPVVNSTLCNG